MSFTVLEKMILGLNEDHLLELPSGIKVHAEAKEDFENLGLEAKKQGFEFKALSGFRSFETQKAIWNAKASGNKALLDDRGIPLNFHSLSKKQIILSIMRWSALPGMSRHHWGTDIDVIDEASRPKDYQVELTPEEVEAGGMFYPLHAWLDQKILQKQSYGFFRPYQKDLGGVAPEMWHISYAPVSLKLEEQLTEEFFLRAIESDLYKDLLLIDMIREMGSELYFNFVKNTLAPQWP